MTDKKVESTKAIHMLKQVPLLHGLQQSEYDILLDICDIQSIRRTDMLFMEGEPSLHFYTLLSGSVEIRTKKQGLIHTVRPGEIFGDIGTIGGIRRTASAVVVKPGKVLKISGTDFNLLLGQAPRICSLILRNITINLASHIVRMNNDNSGARHFLD